MPTYSAGSASVSIGPNLKGFGQELRAELKKVDAEVPVQVVPNTATLAPRLNGELKKVRAQLPVQVVPNMKGFKTKLRDELRKVDLRVPVDANTTKARAEIERLKSTAGDIHMNVDVDRNKLGMITRSLGDVTTAASGASRSIGGVGQSAQSAGGMGAGGIAAIAAAIVAVTPVALGAIGSIGVGLAGLGAAAAPAVGAVVLGIDGIKKAAENVKPALDELRTSVSGAFEQSLAPAMQQMSELFIKIKPAMSGIAGAIGGLGTALATMLNQSPQLQTLLDSVATFVNSMKPGIQDMVQGFLDFGAAVAPVMDVLGGAFAEVLGSLGRVFSKLSNSGVITGVITGFAEALGGLSNFINPLVESMVRLGGIVGPVLGQMFTVLGDIITQLSPIMEEMAVTVGPLLVDMFRMLSPVLQVVFQAVESLMQGLAPLIPVFTRIFEVLASYLLPVFSMWGPVLADLAGTMATVLLDALSQVAPFFPQLAEAVTNLFMAFAPLLPQILGLALSIIPPLTEAFVALAPTIINIINKLTDIVNTIMPYVIPAMQTLQSIVQTVWPIISDVISFAWNNVIKPAWDDMKSTMDTIADTTSWLWEHIIQPSWNYISDKISDAWNNKIKPAWDAMKTALDALARFNSAVVQGIGDEWNSMKEKVATPVNFLIGVVWNKGVLRAWDAIDDFLPIPHAPGPVAQIEGGRQFATGGAVFGPGTSTSDSIAARLSTGEHVLDAGDVESLGGQKTVYALRALVEKGIPFTWDTVTGLAAMPMASIRSFQSAPRGTDLIGGLNPETIPGFADGGAVDEPIWKSQLENGHRAAKMRDGNPYTWGFEDCSGYMSMIADAIINGGNGVRRWATSSFPGGQPWVPGLGKGFSVGVHDDPGGPGGGHTAGTLTGVGQYSTVNVESGGAHGDVAYGPPAAGADSPQWDGVSPGRFHLAIGADGAFESAGGPSPAQKQGWLEKKVNEIIEKLIGPIKSGMANMIGTPPPEWLGIPPAATDVATKGLVDFSIDKVKALGDLLGSVYDKAKDMAGGAIDAVTGFVGGLFRDQGGWLPPGISVVKNFTGKNEAILNAEQWKLIEQLIDATAHNQAVGDIIMADSNATFQKNMQSIAKDAGDAYMQDAFSVIGFPGFDRWTAVGDEWVKATERRTKAEDELAKRNSPDPVAAAATSPTIYPTGVSSEYKPTTFGDPNAQVQMGTVQLEAMPDLSTSTGGGAGVKGAVQKAFTPYGWNTGAQWDAADWIIGKESSWNPTAVNPSSGAFGLFQFLGSTKAQYLPDSNPDPFVQGQAGARYIQDRYGSPIAAKAFWEQNGWYDNGGWLQPGVTLVENRTGKPEPVFSPSQWATLEANVKGGDGGRGPRTIIRQEVTVADQRSAVRELSRQARRDMMVHG